MRIARSTLIGTAVAMALFGRNGAVHAQTSGDQTTSGQKELQEVVVTGIRASLEQAIAQKRAAPTARVTSWSQFGLVLVRRAIVPIKA